MRAPGRPSPQLARASGATPRSLLRLGAPSAALWTALLTAMGASWPARSAAQNAATAQPPLLRSVGRVTIVVDPRHGHPGGLLAVRLTSSARLGSANAILDGRRVPFYPTPRGARALLPIGVQSSSGPATLGIAILGRRSQQRIPVELLIAPRAYAPRSVAVAPEQRAWPLRAEAVRDGRRLLAALRGLTSTPLASESFLAPLAGVVGKGFGSPSDYVGLEPGTKVDSVFDSVAGAFHHGLDYDAAPGSAVRAPADGRVALVASLTLSGWTLVIDHGEAVASVLAHLGPIGVTEGQQVRAGDVVARSGSSGFTAWPHVHWGTYVHAVPVDPQVFLAGLSD